MTRQLASTLGVVAFAWFCAWTVWGTADDRVCAWHCDGTDVAEWTGEACCCADVVEVTP